MISSANFTVWAVLFLSLFLTVTVINAQTPNFSGMWTLDLEASDFVVPAFSGGRGGVHIKRLFITHAENGTLVIGPETNGLKAWSYVPGRELVIPMGRDTTMTAVSRWEEGRLIAEGSHGNMQMHEVMVLSQDGEVLTIEVTTTSPEGKEINRLVYRKGIAVGSCETWAMPCRDFPEFDIERQSGSRN